VLLDPARAENVASDYEHHMSSFQVLLPSYSVAATFVDGLRSSGTRMKFVIGRKASLCSPKSVVFKCHCRFSVDHATGRLSDDLHDGLTYIRNLVLDSAVGRDCTTMAHGCLKIPKGIRVKNSYLELLAAGWDSIEQGLAQVVAVNYPHHYRT
jgi:hypothetical protein